MYKLPVTRALSRWPVTAAVAHSVATIGSVLCGPLPQGIETGSARLVKLMAGFAQNGQSASVTFRPLL